MISYCRAGERKAFVELIASCENEKTNKEEYWYQLKIKVQSFIKTIQNSIIKQKVNFRCSIDNYPWLFYIELAQTHPLFEIQL